MIHHTRFAVLFLGLTLLLAACTAHRNVAEGRLSSSVDVPGPARADVLLLGTFHFDDSGKDDYKPQVDVDILSPKRQSEVVQLLNSLESFRPTKIALELPAARQAALDSAYTEYLSGTLELSENEVHQLGFRLAKRLGHERVWAVDAPARWYDPGTSTEMLIQRAHVLGQQELIGRAIEWIQQHQAYQARVDSLKSGMSLSEYLLYLNSPEHLYRSHSQYLVGQIEVGGPDDYLGADVRTAWYNRNLRIFSNIQRVAQGPGERILVVIGTGHVPILKHLVESSPEFRIVDITAHVRP